MKNDRKNWQLTGTSSKCYYCGENHKPDQCIHQRAKFHYCLKIGDWMCCCHSRQPKQSGHQSPTGMGYLFVCLFVFYGISTFRDYLMPNPF